MKVKDLLNVLLLLPLNNLKEVKYVELFKRC